MSIKYQLEPATLNAAGRQKSSSPRFFRVSAALAAFLGAAILVLSVVMASAARADEEVTSISTATVTASYRHPETGEIADSGGESNAALGQSMVTGTTHEAALVEVDENGLTWVTLRFNLASYLSVLSILYSSPDDSEEFTETSVGDPIQEDTEENTADYRFEIPDTDRILQINLDIGPMGRAVVYYVTFSDLVDSNTDGFVETVTAGQPIATSEEEPAEKEAVEEDETTTAAAETVDEASDNKTSEETEETSGGVSIPLVVGVIVIVVIIVVIVGYLVMRKPKQPKTQITGEDESAKKEADSTPTENSETESEK